MQFIDDLRKWDRRSPAVLIAPAGSTGRRRAQLTAFVAAALSLSPDQVEIAFRRDRRPEISSPSGAGIYLSMGRRGAVVATAVACTPVGVDVEIAEPGGDIPWRVLHPEEATRLEQLSEQRRAAAFARLWSVKEAYVKALGVGFEREPSSFLVRLVEESAATVLDLVLAVEVTDACTVWREVNGARFAISVVTLGLSPVKA